MHWLSKQTVSHSAREQAFRSRRSCRCRPQSGIGLHSLVQEFCQLTVPLDSSATTCLLKGPSPESWQPSVSGIRMCTFFFFTPVAVGSVVLPLLCGAARPCSKGLAFAGRLPSSSQTETSLFAEGNMFTVGAKCPVALQRGRLSEVSYKTCAFPSLLYDTAQLTRKVQTRRRPTFSQTEHYHRSRQTFPLRGGVIPALLRCWKETTVYNNDVYLLPKELLNLVASLVPSRYRCWRSLYCSGPLLVSGSTWSAQKAWTTRKSTTIDLASSVGLNGMKVDTSSLKWIASSSLVFNAQLCCIEEWDDAVQRTAWCKSSSYMSCCDSGVPCDCGHHSVTAQASGRLVISIAGIWSSSDPSGSRCQVPIACKTSPRSRSPSPRFGRSQARRVKTWRPITGKTSLSSRSPSLGSGASSPRVVSIVSLIDQVSIDGAGAVDQMSSTDRPG